MTTHEVRLDLLLGREVRDVNGCRVGRIEELRADRVAEECYVRDFLLGSAAGVRRLLGTLGAWRVAPLAAPWRVMDLRDPRRPRLTVARETLARAQD